MLKRYRKTDAPAWHRKLVLLAGFLFAATILLICAWAIITFISPGVDAAAVPVKGEMG